MTLLTTMVQHAMLIATVAQDTAGKVAYVPREGGPVDTSTYMWVGYAVSALVYGGYFVLMARRFARVRSGRPPAP